jgi:ApaG protein
VSDTTTNGIRVQVRTQFLPQRSTPEAERFVFAYTITISNVGPQTAQLISRHWIITDSDGTVEEVEGPGVVGAQPLLEPGDQHEYTSFCNLKTNVGAMHGSYTMVTADGGSFEARIAPFTLAAPYSLH